MITPNLHTAPALRLSPRRSTLGAVAAALITLFPTTAVRGQSFVNFEGKQTSPIRLSPDGTRLFAVNTPDARVSVFDVSNPPNPILIAEIQVGLEPVSVNARSNDECWVVNEVSDSVSVVSVSRKVVIDTLHVKDEPADVVFAGNQAFITAARRNEIHVFDLSTHMLLKVIPVFGESPRALAVSPDAAKIYAAFALSGNRTTIVPPEFAPAQPQPDQITDEPPQVGLIVDAADPSWSHVIQYTMPDNDVVEIDAATLRVRRYFSGVGTINLGIAVHPVIGDIYVANTDARNLVRFESAVRSHAVLNRLTKISSTEGTISPYDLNPDIDYGVLPNPGALAIALAQPTAVAIDPIADCVYVSAFGTDRIGRIDPTGKVVARIDVAPPGSSTADPRHKRGSRGLALNARTRHLYVLNRIANTLSVIDISTDTLICELPVGSFDPTPAVVRNGRGFLYDAKLSGNGTMSCASCHVDAEMDLLAWDLGDRAGVMETVRMMEPNPTNPGGGPVAVVHDRHPMKGPMTTQTLRGLKGQDPLHWRGDRTNFLHFNGAFETLMGGSVLSTEDMSAFRDFIHTIAFHPNPNQNLDRSYPTNLAGGNARAGRNTFQSEVYQPGRTCAGCHGAPSGGPNPAFLPIVGASVLEMSQGFKIPQLRNLYQKVNFNNQPGAASIGGFGYAHDGRDATLFDTLSAPRFGTFSTDEVKRRNLTAFLLSFDTGIAPAVGYTRTINALNVDLPEVRSDWTLLEKQAQLRTNISLVVKGTINGRRHGLIYEPLTQRYNGDQAGLGPFTRSELVEKILAGDLLTIIGVPVASGTRLGVDRDLNGTFDRDEPDPVLTFERAGPQLVISWSSTAGPFLLEAAESLSPARWRPATSFPVTVSTGAQLLLTVSEPVRFFRLTEP